MCWVFNCCTKFQKICFSLSPLTIHANLHFSLKNQPFACLINAFPNLLMSVICKLGKGINYKACERLEKMYRSFSSDVTAAILVYQNNEMAAILVYGTGISSFLFKYFVLFHHPTGATDHVSENDLLLKGLN